MLWWDWSVLQRLCLEAAVRLARRRSPQIRNAELYNSIRVVAMRGVSPRLRQGFEVLLDPGVGGVPVGLASVDYLVIREALH